ncbi:MAG TPA: radical SAM/SPASM domain-containing protein [Chloroflexota bacterium]
MKDTHRTRDRYRVLQIHVTRRCNLRCLHCYSSSAPEEDGRVDFDALCGALSDASAEGFTVAGFSGGEPLLYKPLPELLRHARSCGMRTTVTSNGMLLDQRRLAALRGNLDLLAISLDGAPDAHDRMRASPGAFHAMASRLHGVRAAGIPFGFIFTLTNDNVDELPWVARFALDSGARLLHVHPLEMLGRANAGAAGRPPDRTARVRARMECLRIQQSAGDTLYVQLDLLSPLDATAGSTAFFTGDGRPDPQHTALAELANPLVIEADGMVVPVEYAFARRYALGNLADASLRILADRWKREVYPAFRDLCREVHSRVAADPVRSLLNPYDAVARQARAASSV